MPDYTTFTTEDFLVDPFFQGWVRNPTAANEAFWQEWLEQHPEQMDEVKLARQLLLSLHPEQPVISPDQIEQDVQRMLQKISVQTSRQPFQILTRSYARWMALAATVVLLLGIGWWFSRPANRLVTGSELSLNQKQNGIRTKRNDTQRPIRVRLPDGSVATLSPRSVLTYPAVFSDSSREVNLVGEAFFEVRRNPAKPFLVYADQIVTRVLGTSFRVSAYPQQQQLTVAVRTGKVAVYARPMSANSRERTVDKRIISLTPNQQVNFSKTDAVFQKMLVEKPIVIDRNVKINDFDFDETPVSDVLQRFEKAYGIAIIYDSDLLRDCALTASLGEETMTEKLGIVCKGIGGTFEIIDGKIVIHSTGCR
ncbi:FecR domain-containing protein [Spirosoma koreense]